MPTQYETDVLNATRDELSGGRLLEVMDIIVNDVQLEGAYPDTEIVVAYSRGGSSESTKSFKLYNRSYPGGEEFPDPGEVACIVAVNVAD